MTLINALKFGDDSLKIFDSIHPDLERRVYTISFKIYLNKKVWVVFFYRVK